MRVSLKRLLPPTLPSLREMPKALVKAALFGAIVGPFLGVFFGWSGPPRAAMVSVVYCIVFYILCALPVGYTRMRFAGTFSSKARIALLLMNLLGIAIASFVMIALFDPLPFQPMDLQVPIVLIMFTLAWGYLVSTRQFADAEKRLANVRAETRMLQSQMNPHFFFNTLNTISALIPEDPAAAQRMLGLVADMSRYASANADTAVVPLASELEFARNYIEIEKARFGNRLKCELPRASDATGLHVPAFTLQPLLENAVRHGISKLVRGGTIAVLLQRQERRFSLAVENDIDDSDFHETVFFQRGHALDNIRERLHLIYDGQASMDVSRPQPAIVCVRMELPVREPQSQA